LPEEETGKSNLSRKVTFEITAEKLKRFKKQRKLKYCCKLAVWKGSHCKGHTKYATATKGSCERMLLTAAS
jgi:hypothetical protein